MTILPERREYLKSDTFTSPVLFLGDGGRINLVDNLLPLTALLLKGQSDNLRDSRSQNLAAGTRSCDRLYQAQF